MHESIDYQNCFQCELIFNSRLLLTGSVTIFDHGIFDIWVRKNSYICFSIWVSNISKKETMIFFDHKHRQRHTKGFSKCQILRISNCASASVLRHCLLAERKFISPIDTSYILYLSIYLSYISYCTCLCYWNFWN